MSIVQFLSSGFWLEGRLGKPSGAGPFPCALITHPHPLFGGSMENNVVYALKQALEEKGYLTLCFNFRGVGGSEGRYGNIEGETQDVISAIEFLKMQKEADLNRLVICGYSFGGLMVLYALSQGLSPQGLVLVSPMSPEQGFLKDQKLKKVLPLNFPALIISGDQDQFFPPSLYPPLLSQSIKSSKIVLVKGADHLFWGFEDKIKEAVGEFINSL